MSDAPRAAAMFSAWYLKDGVEEIGPLSEQQLRHRLNTDSARLASLRVRQGVSDWYPAQAVLDKFHLLAKEGIYVRRDGVADGPFTAEKAIRVLASIDLNGVDAKIGISGTWVPARRLHNRLQETIHGVAGTSESDNIDSEITDGEDAEEPIVVVQPVVEDRPSFEVILLAEPVATVARPPVSPKIATSPIQPPPFQAAHSAVIGRPQPRVQPKQDSTVFWVTATILMVVLVMLVGGIAVFYKPAARAPANTDIDSVDLPAADESKIDTAPVDGPPPVVGRGALFRPKFLTSIGEASGGTMFAARVGTSNRLLLIGAAHLLGPATGLERQLRGAEALIHWQGLEVTDCVNGFRMPVRGEPLRLRTAEFPTKSVNGDSLAIQPEDIRGLEPLTITTEIPNRGDRVWLLAPVRGSQQLVHGGRWVGTDDGWLVYRLDDQALDMVGTSGGAVVNVNHQVFGIHVAGGMSTDGVLSIASPLELIVQEIR